MENFASISDRSGITAVKSQSHTIQRAVLSIGDGTNDVSTRPWPSIRSLWRPMPNASVPDALGEYAFACLMGMAAAS